MPADGLVEPKPLLLTVLPRWAPEVAPQPDAVRPAGRAGWMPGIEALRGLAAAVVVVIHIWVLASAPYFPGFETLLGLGSWAVDVFFLLSGFLLVQSFWEAPRTSSLRQYYIRRIFRIAPGYYVCVAVLFLVLAEHRFLYSISGLRQVLANVTFTQWLFPTTASSLNVSGVFWTLSLEVFLYALLPAFAWLISRRPVLLGGTLFVIGMAYRLYVAFDAGWLQSTMFRSLPDHPEAVMRLFLLRQFPGIMPLFLMGMFLRWWMHYRPGRAQPSLAKERTSMTVLILLLVPSTLVLYHVIQANDFQHGWLFALFDVGVCILILPALAYAGRTVTGGLSFATKVFAWLGKRSYGIYLWHFPVILLVLERGAMERPPDLSMIGVRLVAIVVLSIALGAASYRFVEKPGRRAGHRLAVRLG